jgi:hypothetical protein
MNANAQAGGTTDLLSSIMGVTIRNEEKIAVEDREFCEARQEKLYATLRHLKEWYDLLTAKAERYRESRNLIYEQNGSIEKYNLRNVYHNEGRDDYAAFEFIPVESINEVVKLYGRAVEAFTRDVVSHFNDKYGVSVPLPDIDDEKLPMGFMPTYQTCVDAVIAHLGGKGFRETAEEELIARFHKVLMPYSPSNFKAELRGDRIVIPNVLRFDSYIINNMLSLSWNSETDLSHLCAGIIFGTMGSLNGGVNYIADYDRHDVDVSRWYSLIGGSVSVKFFKNHRVDFKFENAAAAERCWKKLRLDTIKPKTDNE